MGYHSRVSLRNAACCGVEQLVGVIGVETWFSDRLFLRYFFNTSEQSKHIAITMHLFESVFVQYLDILSSIVTESIYVIDVASSRCCYVSLPISEIPAQ